MTGCLRNMINLSFVQRWIIVPMLRRDSVAEHSYRVAAIAEFLADRLEQHDDHKTKLDRLRLLRLALRHDLDEVLSGDIPTPCKRYIDGFSIKTMVAGTIIDSGGSPESHIVKTADYLDTLMSLRLFGVEPFKQNLIVKIEGDFIDWVDENTATTGLNVYHFGAALEEARTLLYSDLTPNWMKESNDG